MHSLRVVPAAHPTRLPQSYMCTSTAHQDAHLLPLEDSPSFHLLLQEEGACEWLSCLHPMRSSEPASTPCAPLNLPPPHVLL